MDAIRENIPLLLQGIGTTVALTLLGIIAAAGVSLAVPPKYEATTQLYVSVRGESGAVGMGVIDALMTDPAYAALKQQLGLDATSRVLLFSTEGDTDPENYRKIVWNGAVSSI